VAIALWRLAGGASFRTIATHFDVAKSTCVTITKEFCKALNRLVGNYIKFPSNRDETAKAISLFQDDCKIPQAVGAIDGTHIEIIAPDEPFDYFDRHHRYSVTMQAVLLGIQAVCMTLEYCAQVIFLRRQRMVRFLKSLSLF
jgi:hypothetical protein